MACSRTSPGRVCVAALALLQLFAVTSAKGHNMPVLRVPEMGDNTHLSMAPALTALRRLTATLEDILGAKAGGELGVASTAGQELGGALAEHKSRSLATGLVRRATAVRCPKAGCRCIAVTWTSPCGQWVCCSKASAFVACSLATLVASNCPVGAKAKMDKKLCADIKSSIVLFGSFVAGRGKTVAKRCPAVVSFYNVLLLVRKKLGVAHQRCC